MQNLLEVLKKELSKDERLLSENEELLKNKIIELSLKLDKDLITILLKNKELKDHFFVEVEKNFVFDQNKFIKFVDNKEFLPDSYTSFKNKVGLTSEDKYLSQNKEVVLSWPYKDCILEGGMTKEDQKRNEVFFNEILAPDEIDRLKDPKVFTNFKRIYKKGENTVKEIKNTDNLIIRGNNLLALYSLKKKFAGKVKLIYIDPPYNTGSDSFSYNDAFNHSTWLTFMKNRLEIARDLLHKEGSIFIQCDDNEQAYLKVLCDEIFGRDNFRSQISWLRTSSGKTSSRTLSNDVDTILWYSNTSNYVFNHTFKPLSEKTKAMYKFDDKDGRGIYRLYPLQKTGGPGPETTYDYIDNSGKKWKCPAKGWRMNKTKLKALENDNRLYLEGNTIGEKAYWNERENEGKIANNLWEDIPNLQGSNKEFLNFSGQKPELLLKRIFETSSREGDLILDFFGGSGTTGIVAHKMKRQYILVEQMGSQVDILLKRLKNVIEGDQSGISKAVDWKGGGDFVYCELMQWNEKYLEEIKKSKDSKELIKIWNLMKEKAFLSYKVSPDKFDKEIKEFEKLKLEDQKKFLIECLELNQLYVNLSEIDDKIYGVSKEDKELNKKFYGGL